MRAGATASHIVRPGSDARHVALTGGNRWISFSALPRSVDAFCVGQDVGVQRDFHGSRLEDLAVTPDGEFLIIDKGTQPRQFLNESSLECSGISREPLGSFAPAWKRWKSRPAQIEITAVRAPELRPWDGILSG